MCARALEKSLKGYLLLNGATPASEWRHTPYGAAVFSDRKTIKEWVDTARRVRDTLAKLWSTIDRATLG